MGSVLAAVLPAVLSILITAPLGALCVDYSYKKLLARGKECGGI